MKELPVKPGWIYSKCGRRYEEVNSEAFRKRALEDLYTVVDPGGGESSAIFHEGTRSRLLAMLDELSVALVGGVPEDYEEYT